MTCNIDKFLKQQNYWNFRFATKFKNIRNLDIYI